MARIFAFVAPGGVMREFFTENPNGIFVAYTRDGRAYVKEVTRNGGNWIADTVFNQGELVGADIHTTRDLLPRMARITESNTAYVVYNPEFEDLDEEEKYRRAYQILKAIQLVTGDRMESQGAASHQESTGAMQQVQDALNIPIPTVPGITTPGTIVLNITTQSTAQGGYATADSDSASTSNSSAQAEATADADADADATADNDNAVDIDTVTVSSSDNDRAPELVSTNTLPTYSVMTGGKAA